MFYGNESIHLAYPILNEEADFKQKINQFKSYNELVFAPLDIEGVTT